VPLGEVGEISFWAPNRGLLITGGTEAEGGPVPAGLYAYDGVSWHQLSTVCGGAEGRIVWAGPDDFWTISDQRSGQLTATNNSNQTEARSVSLCHFLGGQVVGSYAVPREEPSSWRQMAGGACYSPTDCWFGGEDGSAPNVGAFHLHWDGRSVSAFYEPEDHAVASMISFQGTLYESAQLEAGDAWLTEEERKRPPVLHTIAPFGSQPPFSDLVMYSAAAKHVLPLYGEKVLPEALQGFGLAVDAPLGAAATQLWAAANPVREAPNASKPASVTVLRESGGAWSQLLPAAGVPSPLGETLLGGSPARVGTQGNERGGEAIAPEPGSEAAWLSLHQRRGGAGAEVALLEAATCEPQAGAREPCAKLLETDTLPNAAEGVGNRGEAGPIVCPAPHDCWMATFAEPASRAGWLFHLSDGAPVEPNGDPFFDGAGGVISYRPPDSGVPAIYPDAPPEDDSLANQQQAPPPAPPPPAPVRKIRPAKAIRLVLHIQSRLLHHRTLEISFTLTAGARVQIVGRRGRMVVARTPRRRLGPGRHRLELTLDPARWPTHMRFDAKPILPSSLPGEGAGESSSSEAIVT
jgi:hypothetical protein